MKQIKKLISIMLTMAMVFTMSATVFAAEGEPTTYKITISNEARGHIYEAYQIFKGDLAIKDGKKVLSNIEWGTGISDAGKPVLLGDKKNVVEYAESLQEYEAEETATLAQQIGQYLATAAGTSTYVTAAEGKEAYYVIEGLAPGYYLVKDKDGSLTGNDNYTTFILEVVGDASANVKNTGVPTPDKKVKDKNDSEGTTTNWQDSADHDIGDVIDYELKATLPDTVSAYDKYQLVFEDSLSDGLTYQKGSVVVKKNGTVISEEGYTLVEPNGDGGTLSVSFADVKIDSVNAVNGDVITVEYKAKLNDKAKIGAEGNENTLVLKYSNNPNNSGDGEGEPTGTTPPVTAIVFTFETVVNKVDENTKPLEGAAFKLEKLIKGEEGTDDTWSTIKEFTVEDGKTSFDFKGLDDGRYRLVETATPAGYNTIADVYFKITATHDEASDDPKLKTLEVVATDENGNSLTGDNVTKFTVQMTETEPKTPTGNISTDIVNQSGSTLPSTGGIGTTIFYIIGGILVVGAAILLVTKKRMGKEA